MSVHARRTVAASLAIAWASMWLAPTTLNFDPWAWLVWGREVAGFDLDTTGGPSWKPFPVLVTTVLSAFGDAAPALWMLVARAGGVLTMVVIGVLALRLARRTGLGPWAARGAGAAAAAALILSPDPEPRWTRTVLEAHSAPLAAGFVTWAVERHLAGRPRRAFAALVAASLIRPEAWPFLIAYGLWLLRTPDPDPPPPASKPVPEPVLVRLGTVRRALSRTRTIPRPVLVRLGTVRRALSRTRTVVVGSWVAVAVLWFGGDLWGSGSAWHGADSAQVGPSSLGERVDLAVEVTVEMVAPAVWVLAMIGAVATWRRWRAEHRPADAAVLAVLALAVAWVGMVVALTLALGYAAISRFLLAPAALLCVVAGLGLARLLTVLVDTIDSRTTHSSTTTGRVGVLAVAVVAVVVAAAASVPRVVGLTTVWAEVRDRGEIAADLDDAVDRAVAVAGNRQALLDCGVVSIEVGPLVRPQLPWLLDLPLHRVAEAREPVRPGVMFIVQGSKIARTQTAKPPDEWTVLADTDHWLVLAIRCPSLLSGT